jgi:hypothetical protein
MEMGVRGRKPDSKVGEVFSANCGAWPPIVDLMFRLCRDLLSINMLLHIHYYDTVAGPEDQATCTAMAERFEQWLEWHTEGHFLDEDLMKATGRLTLFEEAVLSGEDVKPAYQVSDDQLKWWVEFLRHCGGFAVE